MPPYQNLPFSPAELSYLHTSLTQSPPIRPDGRASTHFRPLIAESDILPAANGSARICFADGTEAVVGVKAEVEKTERSHVGLRAEGELGLGRGGGEEVEDDEEGMEATPGKGRGRNEWVEIAIDVPGLRDDDALPIFLSAMLSEALLADPGLKDRLYINPRFHWRLYIDILLLSQPLSYPLPLLSLTTHLALLSTRLPALISEKDEDPLFNDDWEASTFLYPRDSASKPPVTLLVMSVDETILFDPSREELAIADAVLAISLTSGTPPSSAVAGNNSGLKVVAIRTLDPPSRLTAPGVPNVADSTTTGAAGMSAWEVQVLREQDQGGRVWRAPRGGVRRGMVGRMVKMCVEKGGVGEEVLAGLAGVEG